MTERPEMTGDAMPPLPPCPDDEAETTAAQALTGRKPTPRERAEHVVRWMAADTPPAEVVVTVLAVALDAEELAREFHRQGAWCGDCDYDGWGSCSECRQVCRGYAVALRDFTLRGPA